MIKLHCQFDRILFQFYFGICASVSLYMYIHTSLNIIKTLSRIRHCGFIMLEIFGVFSRSENDNESLRFDISGT